MSSDKEPKDITIETKGKPNRPAVNLSNDEHQSPVLDFAALLASLEKGDVDRIKEHFESNKFNMTFDGTEGNESLSLLTLILNGDTDLNDDTYVGKYVKNYSLSETEVASQALFADGTDDFSEYNINGALEMAELAHARFGNEEAHISFGNGITPKQQQIMYYASHLAGAKILGMPSIDQLGLLSPEETGQISDAWEARIEARQTLNNTIKVSSDADKAADVVDPKADDPEPPPLAATDTTKDTTTPATATQPDLSGIFRNEVIKGIITPQTPDAGGYKPGQAPLILNDTAAPEPAIEEKRPSPLLPTNDFTAAAARGAPPAPEVEATNEAGIAEPTEAPTEPVSTAEPEFTAEQIELLEKTANQLAFDASKEAMSKSNFSMAYDPPIIKQYALHVTGVKPMESPETFDMNEIAREYVDNAWAEMDLKVTTDAAPEAPSPADPVVAVAPVPGSPP